MLKTIGIHNQNTDHNNPKKSLNSIYDYYRTTLKHNHNPRSLSPITTPQNREKIAISTYKRNDKEARDFRRNPIVMTLSCSFLSSKALIRAIGKEQWNRVLLLLENVPHQAQQWSNQSGFFDGCIEARVLPLHRALAVQTSPIPTNVLEMFIQAYPPALQLAESSYERLPLHCACRRPGATLALIEPLVRAFPDACLVPDALQRLPLHYALTNGASVQVILYLLQVHPQAARGVDIHGYTPLHVACAQLADLAIIHCLVELYPQAVVMASTSGITVRHCLPLPLSSCHSPTTTFNHDANHNYQSASVRRRFKILQVLTEAQEQYDSTNPTLRLAPSLPLPQGKTCVLA